jgi:2-keto-4-pentenoate hydratase
MAELHPRVVAAQQALFGGWRDGLRAGAARIGWKIGHNIAEVQNVIGNQPVVGYLTSATLLQDGETFWARGSVVPRAVSEVVIEVAHTVTDRASSAMPSPV